MTRPPTDSSGTTAPAVSAVVLAFRDEPWLERCVHALLDSTGVDVEVVLVDNGCTDGAVERLAQTPGVAVVRPGENLGFAGGCNAGAAVASGEFLALINGDLVERLTRYRKPKTPLSNEAVEFIEFFSRASEL